MAKVFLGLDFEKQRVNLFALEKKLWRKRVLGSWQVAREDLATELAAICQTLPEEPTLVVGLSRKQLIYRTLTLPPMPSSALPDAIGYQLVEQSPLQLEEIRYAYRAESNKEGWQIEAVAVAAGELERIKSLLEPQGFAQILFAPSSQALAAFAKEGELVGRKGEDLQLGLPGSFWGRDLALLPDLDLDQELAETVSYLEGSFNQKLTVKLAPDSWQPRLEAPLKERELVAAGLAFLGAQREVPQFLGIGEERREWLTSPLSIAVLSLWLILGLFAAYGSLSLKRVEKELAQQANTAATYEDRTWQDLEKELNANLPRYSPQLPLSVLRQMALSLEEGEGYLSLVYLEGEIQELTAKTPLATDLIMRLQLGPLSRLTLEGPITKDEDLERFSLRGPVEVSDHQ